MFIRDQPNSLIEQAKGEASKRDRLYFNQNKTRKYRIRKMIAGEFSFEETEGAEYVVVKKINDTQRFRVPCNFLELSIDPTKLGEIECKEVFYNCCPKEKEKMLFQKIEKFINTKQNKYGNATIQVKINN